MPHSGPDTQQLLDAHRSPPDAAATPTAPRRGLTLPQAWQWWRLRVREKSQPQFMHIITCVTGTRVGGLSPRLTPSLSRIWNSGIGQAMGSGDQLDGRPPTPYGVCT